MNLIGNLILAVLLCLPQIAGAVCIEGDCINGTGTAVLPDGSRYVGEFREGVRSGRGEMVFPDGSRYDGDWLHDKPHGTGTLIIVNTFEYTGEFADGIRQGQGTLETDAGKRYEGQWQNDVPHGQGRFSYPGEEEFVGQYVNGRRHGQGEAVYADGSRYKGEWAADLPNGQGVKTLADGVQYTGEFRDGLMYGTGIMVMPDGSQIKIQWQNDAPGEREEKEPGTRIAEKDELKSWYMSPSFQEIQNRYSRAPLETAGHSAVSEPEPAESPEEISLKEPGVADETAVQVLPQDPEDVSSAAAEQGQQGDADIKMQPPAAVKLTPEAVMPVGEKEGSGPQKGYALYSESAGGVQYARLAEGANIRSGASLQAEVLRTAPAGYPVAVLEHREDWVLVEDFRERQGWIYAPLLTEPETVIIKVYKGNLRRGPSLTADVIVQLDHGTVVAVGETKGDWLRVRGAENVTGWLHRKIIWP